MAAFIYGTEINLRLEELIANADEFLWFISPYIKLHDKIKDELRRIKDQWKLEIVIVFGKNENDRSKSISKEDIDFLKDFPNIKICYEKNLHAKFYASEDFAILCSMNLHQYSQNSNIEAGIILSPRSPLKKLSSLVINQSDAGVDALGYFEGVIEHSQLIFEKVPEYKEGFMRDKYTGSKIEIDTLDEFFANPLSNYIGQKSNGFGQPIINPRPKPICVKTSNTTNFTPGFCIRTGIAIPFDPKKPLSTAAYKSWNQFKDPNYPEKYCHFSGESSNGETSVGKPILRKNWNNAKEWK